MLARSSAMPVIDIAEAGEVTGHGLRTYFGRLADSWRKVRASHISADALADLDMATLRDIGLEADEVARAHSGEDFVPRAWA